jgi:hypothetical protein
MTLQIHLRLEHGHYRGPFTLNRHVYIMWLYYEGLYLHISPQIASQFCPGRVASATDHRGLDSSRNGTPVEVRQLFVPVVDQR